MWIISLKIKLIKYPINVCHSYKRISPTHQAYLEALSVVHAPRLCQEVVQYCRWVDAMQSELQSLQDNHTWKLVHLPHGKIVIGYN